MVGRIADGVRANPEVEMTVDLARQVIERPGMGPVPFQIDSRRRANLLLGSDTTLDEQLQHSDSATVMRIKDRSARPWIYDTRGDRDPP